MRVFLTVLYCLLMTPVQAYLYLALTEKSPPCGYVRVVIGGIPFRVPVLLGRAGEGKGATLYLGFRAIPLRRRQPKAPLWERWGGLQKTLRAGRKGVHADARILLGLPDAAATALLCAGVNEAFRLLRVTSEVKPLYGHPSFTLQLRCIACFRLGKLFLTAAALGLSLLRQNTAGRVRHGNQQGQANQLRDADGA